MREINPYLRRMAQLVDLTAPGCKLAEESARQAAHSIGATLSPYYVQSRADLERAFSQMEKERPEVLLPCPSFILYNLRDVLFENLVRLRIPLTSYIVANVPDGVLFAYATSLHETFRSAATYVDKILKRRQAGRSPNRATDEVRPRHQPEDREGHGDHRSTIRAV